MPNKKKKGKEVIAMDKRRGRPSKPADDKVLSNGLFPRQWERIQREAKKHGFSEGMPYLRNIVDEYFAQKDAEAASAEENAEGDRDYEKMTKGQ